MSKLTTPKETTAPEYYIDIKWVISVVRSLLNMEGFSLLFLTVVYSS